MDFDPDLERLIDRELTALPEPRAPRTLLPRIMTAVHAARPRTSGGWFTWPLVWANLIACGDGPDYSRRGELLLVAADTLGAVVSNLSADTSSRLGGVIRQVEALVSAAAPCGESRSPWSWACSCCWQ